MSCNSKSTCKFNTTFSGLNFVVEKLAEIHSPFLSPPTCNRVHLGIQTLLCHHFVHPEKRSDDEKVRDAILGQRVAKTFNTRFRGDPMTYRGTVSAVTRGPEDKGLEEDEYTIVYDDSDREDVGLTELYGKCMLWEEDEGSLCSSALADTKHTILAQTQMSLFLLRLAHVLPFQG